LADNFSNNLNISLSENSEYENVDTLEFNQALQNYSSRMQELFNSWTDKLQQEDINIPTMFVEKVIDELLQWYNILFSPIYSQTFRDNILAWWRRQLQDIDTHIHKIMKQDDIFFRDINTEIMPTIQNFNQILEETLNHKIEQEKYYMYIPLITSYTENSYIDRNEQCFPIQNTYTPYFFWQTTDNIQSIQDLHIYRWTHQNLTWIQDISIPITWQSIWATYNIFSQQIQANRLYNNNIIEEEIQLRENNDQIPKKQYGCNWDSIIRNTMWICVWTGATRSVSTTNLSCSPYPAWNNEESIADFANRLRWWASPINIHPERSQNLPIPNIPYYPDILPQFQYYKHAILPILDLWWSKKLNQQIPNTYNTWAIQDFWSLILSSDQAWNIQYFRCEWNIGWPISDQASTIDQIPFVEKISTGIDKSDFFQAYNISTQYITWNQIASQQTIHIDYSTGICWLRPSGTWLSFTSVFVNDYFKESRRFKIIDSRYYHTSPTQEELESINITTPDRAIDSIRRISFLWIWWSEISLEYPNLYSIPVYKEDWSTLILKSITEIQESIKTTLRDSINDYNILLNQELSNSQSYYNSNSWAFLLLSWHNNLASPNRNYNIIDEDFFVDSLWEENIEIIATLLYKQNMMRPSRNIHPHIQEEIESLSDLIDINQKISHTMQNYLTQNNNLWPLLSPGYSDNGYEIAYINTDWIHTIDSSSTPSFIQTLHRHIQDQENSNRRSREQAQQYNDPLTELNRKEQEACGYDPSSPVPLIQRPSAFSCRLKETMKKPFELSFKFNVSSSSFDDMLDNVSDQRKTQISQYHQEPQHDSRFQSVQEQYNNDEIIEQLGWNLRQRMESFRTFLQPQVNENIIFLNPEASSQRYISIANSTDLWNAIVRISATWDNCPIIPWRSNNLCNNHIVLNQNFYNNPAQLDIIVWNRNYPLSTIAWDTFIIYEICHPNNSSICIHKRNKISILAWEINSTEIIAPNQAIRWETVPLMVIARDEFSNQIWAWIQEFTIRSSTGLLNDWRLESNEISFTDFSRAMFTYTPPQNLAHNSTINLIVSPSRTWSDIRFSAKEINIKQATVRLNTWSISYKLPSPQEIITQNNWIPLLNTWIFPFVNIRIQDIEWQALETHILVSSQNNLFRPINNKAENTFRSDNNWNITIFLEPKYIVGQDILKIIVPWLQNPIDIPVEILAWEAYRTHIEIDKQKTLIKDNDTILTWTIKVYDARDNLVTKETQVQLWWLGALNINGSRSQIISITWWSSQIQVSSLAQWWIWYIYSILHNTNLSRQIPFYQKIIYQTPVLPQSWLNVMYLNLRWTDRWNQRWYFSDIDRSFTHNHISSSDKLLTITSQLIDPSKLKQSSVIIRSWLNILNPWNENIFLVNNNDNELFINISEKANIFLWNKNSFNIRQIQDFDEIDISNNIETIFYKANISDSINQQLVSNNQIILNDEVIFDIHSKQPQITIKLSEQENNERSIREVFNSQNNKIWEMILYSPFVVSHIDSIISRSQILDRENISLNKVFSHGSTNSDYAISLTLNNSIFTSNDNFSSIHDSNDSTLWIWFTDKYKSISNFAAWQTVWDASKHFSSSFLINIWDPILKRIDRNPFVENTDFDSSIWHNIYSNNSENIQKVIATDFNNDGTQDLVIAHKNWSIKLLKNYWWNDWFKNLQELLHIQQWIKDIFLWDVDNSWYPDIIIRNNNNQLRVYQNRLGMIDIDGKPICLDIPLWPDSLDGAYQIFFEDMDQDGNLDIISNNIDWTIKVFYGWSSSLWNNFISSLSYNCDDQVQNRSRINSTLVKQFWVQIDPNIRIVDDSLTRRRWYSMPWEDINESLVPIVSEMLWLTQPDISLENETDTIPSNLWAEVSNILRNQWPLSRMQDLDINKINQLWWEQILRHIANPFNLYPNYESIPPENISYIPIKHLKDTDPVNIYKTYSSIRNNMLIDQDEVIVTVHIQSHQNTIITFADKIRWPWIIKQDSNWVIQDFDPWNLNTQASILRNTDHEDFHYIIDNIILQSWQNISFSYTLTYQSDQIMHIDVKNISHTWYNDSYPAIIAYNSDSCSKYTRTYFNNWNNNHRDYDEIFTNLRDNISDYNNQRTENSSWAMNEIFENIWWPNNQATIDNYIPPKQTKQPILKTSFDTEQWWPNISFDLTLDFEGSEKISEELNKALDWLCQWFSLWKDDCQWPPVPFNMAFLSPWDFNIFGCKLTEDKWLPTFFFPWTVYVKWVPIPIPNWLKWPTDEFYRAAWWKFPSQIRIYTSPTLTQQVWIVICLWPQWPNPPSPLRDMWWNCIVIAAPISCGSSDLWSSTQDPNTIRTDQLDNRRSDVENTWVCTENTITETRRWRDGSNYNYSSSPFSLVSKWQNQNTASPSIPSWVYGFGLIWLDKKPILAWLEPPSTDTIDIITLKAWPDIDLKIQWWDVKWLMQCVVQDRADRQIKYIINNLSQMTVWIYLPQIWDLFWWFEHINTENLQKIFSWSAHTENLIRNADTSSTQWLEKIWNRAQNNWVQQWHIANVSAVISNPFETIAQIFEKVKLVNITHKDIIVSVPFIYSEDIIRYTSYLQARIDTQEEIIQERKDNPYLSENLQLINNMEEAVRSVKQNIKILEEYQRFPIKLYEWFRAIDKYMTELTSFISNFFWTINYRLSSNASRYSQYVDAIITMLAVIKTREILRDFAVNRWEKCWTCTNDVYDFYSCSLSMLCPSLPILPIPPFKLPNIFIDLSRINLWIQIILPVFKFIPTTIPLARLPNLPRPPSLHIEWWLTIPEIPLLPAPPTLPPLPSLIPEIQLDLPILPPAPKIPAILPSIQWAINMAEFVWEIMCILKWQWVWLVSEQWVKSKIEQMTQRTRNVPFFDYLDLTSRYQDPPLQWFDYQIDSFVDIQFNFDGIYDVINSMATTVNEQVSNPAQEIIYKDVQFIENQLNTPFVDELRENIEQLDTDAISDQFNSYNIPEVDYRQSKRELIAWLQELYNKTFDISIKNSIQSILKTTNHKVQITAETEQLQEAENQTQTIVNEHHRYIQNLQKKILEDYDWFLDDIKSRTIVLTNNNIWEETDIYVSLFDVDPQSISTLQNAENPILTYLNIQEWLAQWFRQSLENNNHISLNMDPVTHNTKLSYFQQTEQNISSIKNQLQISTNTTLQWNNNPTSNTNTPNTIQNKPSNNYPILANLPTTQPNSTNNNWSEICEDCNRKTLTTASSDPSQYVRWIFVQWDNDKIINIVQSQDQITKSQNKYIIHDITKDGNNDIILRDNHSIYIKYANQNDLHNSSISTNHHRYYSLSPINRPSDLERLTDNNGYINIRSNISFFGFSDTVRLKIYDIYQSSKWFTRQTQNMDNIIISRQNHSYMWENVDGYLIRVNNRIDTYHDKLSILSFISSRDIENQYIIILPEEKEIRNNDRIIFPWSNTAQNIKQITWSWQQIAEIFYYDPDQNNISIAITEISRKRKYLQIAPISDRWNQNVSIYQKKWPRSNQILWWQSIINDNTPPTAELSLIRRLNNSIVDSWIYLEWYINTNYILDINRQDNVAVQQNRIRDQQWNLIMSNSWNQTSISWLLFTQSETINFTIWAIDFNNNINTQDITLEILIPEIETLQVNQIWPHSWQIIAEISHQIDIWSVRFEGLKDNSRWRKTLENTSQISLFPTSPFQTLITWEVFYMSENIWLYDSSENKIWSINPQNWTITISSWYQDRYNIILWFTQFRPTIHIFDNQLWTDIFQINYQSRQLHTDQAINIIDQNIDIKQLWSDFQEPFSNWYCILQNNQCISYISTQWHLFVAQPHNQNLKWHIDFFSDHLRYIITDSNNQELYSLSIQIKELKK